MRRSDHNGTRVVVVVVVGIFHALGTDTSVYCRSNQVMRRFDPLLRDTLTAAMDTYDSLHPSFCCCCCCWCVWVCEGAARLRCVWKNNPRGVLTLVGGHLMH